MPIEFPSLLVGFLLGVLWAISAGIVVVGYYLLNRAGREREPERATGAHTMILSSLLGILFLWSLLRNAEEFSVVSHD